jgi:hypothetical protein
MLVVFLALCFFVPNIISIETELKLVQIVKNLFT